MFVSQIRIVGFFFTLFTGPCLVQMGTSQLLYSHILHLTKFLLILGTYGHICIFCRAAGYLECRWQETFLTDSQRPGLVIEQPGKSRIPAPKLVFKNTHCLPLAVAKIASYYWEYCRRKRSKHLSCPSVPTIFQGSQIMNKSSSSWQNSQMGPLLCSYGIKFLFLAVFAGQSMG